MRAGVSGRMSEPAFIEHYQHYAKDCAGCDCAPTHTFHGVPCIAVSRFAMYVYGHDHPTAVDRCKGCGTEWPAINYRWERRR